MLRPACLGAALISVILTGCGGSSRPAHPPPAALSPAQQAQSAETRQRLIAAEGLCKQLAADPALTPLRGRILPPDAPVTWTREMMTDANQIDEHDRALLLILDERRAACRRAMFTASPDQAVPLLDYWQRQDSALIRLYQREITIGAYNRAMADAQAQLAIDTTNMAADSAARANQGVAPMSSGRTEAPQLPADSFRALVIR